MKYIKRYNEGFTSKLVSGGLIALSSLGAISAHGQNNFIKIENSQKEIKPVIQDLQRYISIITDSNRNDIAKNKSIENAVKLFDSEDSRVYINNKSVKIRTFLMKIKLLNTPIKVIGYELGDSKEYTKYVGLSSEKSKEYKLRSITIQ